MSVVSSYSVHSYTHLNPTQFSSCSHHCSNNCCQPNIHTPILVLNSPISCMHRDEATSCTYIYFGLKPFSESPIWRDVGGSDTSPIQKHHSAPPYFPLLPTSPPIHSPKREQGLPPPFHTTKSCNVECQQVIGTFFTC